MHSEDWNVAAENEFNIKNRLSQILSLAGQ